MSKRQLTDTQLKRHLMDAIKSESIQFNIFENCEIQKTASSSSSSTMFYSIFFSSDK